MGRGLEIEKMKEEQERGDSSTCLCSELVSERREEETYIAHVLRQQVLQSLTDRVALGHDALAPVVAGTGRVGHEGGATDDALQALLQRRAETLLAKRQGVHDDLLLLGGGS